MRSKTAVLVVLAICSALTPAHARVTPPAFGVHTDGPELAVGGLPPSYDADVLAPWSPNQYDGAVFTSDAPDLTDLPAVHAVYVVPSDAPNRFAEFAAMFQADARQASGLLRTLYGRGIRLDEREGADGRRYVDITLVVSQYSTARLALPQFQFGLVAAELDRIGLRDPDKKYAVWLDAPSFACGQAQLAGDRRRSAANFNERSTIAIVYRNYARSPGGSTGDPNGGGFCRGRVLVHELGHALGALQDEAPNNFDGGHCSDSAEDVMCYRPPALIDTGPAAFDYGNDDYWDPAANPASGSSARLGWWTANLSRFVCPASGCDQPNANPGY